MGGYGTWLLAAERPGRFAAIVPICGGVKPPRNVPIPKASRFGHHADPYSAVAEASGTTPTGAFQGASDWVVPPEETRRLVAALRARGNQVRHTEYAGVGHQSWVPAYADPKLFEWLAAQRRSAAATAPMP
jgi:predicted peptidase